MSESLLQLYSAPHGSLPPLPSEQVLLGVLPRLAGEQALVISPGRGQAAWELAQTARRVDSWYMDTYDAWQAKKAVAEVSVAVEIVGGADLPESPYDLIAMPILVGGEAELTRDLMQQAHQRLIDGGTLVVSVDNPRDQWLRLQMQELFEKVTCTDAPGGRAYWGRKTKPLKKVRNFGCDFSFRDEDHLIHAHSRPGVFSHRRLDPGARQLLLAAEIEPGQHILDMGCGCGVVALAVAQRSADTRVMAVDSCARAIACTQFGAEANKLGNISAIVNYDGNFDIGREFDVVLGNPPYYGDFRIAGHFLATAQRVLRPGGAVLIVTKQPKWYEENMVDQWQDVTIFESGNYFVACGRK